MSADDSACAVKLDALPAGCAHHGLPANQTGVQLVVEWTPGTRVFMTFPEGLPCHMQVIKATVKAIEHMRRVPVNIPITIAWAALHPPGRMCDTCWHVRIEPQWFAV